MPRLNPTSRLRAPFALLRRRGLPLVSLLLLAAAVPPAAAAAGPTRAELRETAQTHFDQAFLARGRAYHRLGYLLYFVESAVILAAAWALVLGPLGAWGRQALRTAGGRPWLARLLVLSALVLGFALLRFPFSLTHYLHAKAFGLRHDPVASWLGDWVKSLGVGWLLAAVVGLLVLGLFARWPRAWWPAAGAAVALLTVLYVALSPLVVDPLFNRFHRLQDRALETRLLDLAREGGVPATEVLVADASRRTPAVNAYFTGVGNTQRIVLYDTLLQKFTPDEVALVVAHEVGHWRLHHVRKGLALGAVAVFLGLGVGHLVLGGWSAAGWRGISGRGDPALAIPAYALYISLMLISVAPSNWISRRMESQADRESLVLTDDPATFVRAEVRLARENLSDVFPPAWIEDLLYTHPCTARRIHTAERWH